MINKATDELQVPIAQLSARVHEPVQEKPSDVECDSCQVSFKLPPGMLGPKPKKKKKQQKLLMKKLYKSYSRRNQVRTLYGEGKRQKHI